MFNCQKIFKLQIRPPTRILVITTSQVNISQPKLRSEKFDNNNKAVSVHAMKV